MNSAGFTVPGFGYSVSDRARGRITEIPKPGTQGAREQSPGHWLQVADLFSENLSHRRVGCWKA
jgi:hypothetical protein